MKTVDRILGEATNKSPYEAYLYAKYVVKGRWPEGEKTIATDPEWAHLYARDVIQGRWPEAEEAIARDPVLAYWYLKVFPEAADDWAINGWIDWLDT